MFDVIFVYHKLIGRLMHEDKKKQRDERIDSIINTKFSRFFVHIYIFKYRNEKGSYKIYLCSSDTYYKCLHTSTTGMMFRKVIKFTSILCV